MEKYLVFSVILLFGIIAICFLVHQKAYKKGKKEGKGQLADFYQKQIGSLFYVESVAKEVGICHLRDIDSGKSLWYKIPMLGAGYRELIHDKVYKLCDSSYGFMLLLEYD